MRDPQPNADERAPNSRRDSAEIPAWVNALLILAGVILMVAAFAGLFFLV